MSAASSLKEDSSLKAKLARAEKFAPTRVFKKLASVDGCCACY
jgi:hypothetical protein